MKILKVRYSDLLGDAEGVSERIREFTGGSLEYTSGTRFKIDCTKAKAKINRTDDFGAFSKEHRQLVDNFMLDPNQTALGDPLMARVDAKFWLEQLSLLRAQLPAELSK